MKLIAHNELNIPKSIYPINEMKISEINDFFLPKKNSILCAYNENIPTDKFNIPQAIPKYARGNPTN